VDYGKHDLDAKLKLHADDAHRVVIMTDEEIVALVRRVSELRAEYKAARYAVTRWGAKHPKWTPEG
jgi:hypothetical protein